MSNTSEFSESPSSVSQVIKVTHDNLYSQDQKSRNDASASWGDITYDLTSDATFQKRCLLRSTLVEPFTSGGL